MNQSILLIGPSFFGYESKIKKELQHLGYNCFYIDDRLKNDTLTKAVIRLNKNFIKSKIDKYFDDQFRLIEDQNFDKILLYSPEAISENHIIFLKQKYTNAKFYLYMWDSVYNKPQAKAIFGLFDYKYSFDAIDCSKYDMEYLPLFYCDEFYPKKNNGKTISFIGTGHGDRVNIVKNIVSQITQTDHGYQSNIFFYIQSRLVFLYMFLFDKKFRKARLRDFSFTPISLQKTANIIMNSSIVIDVNHINQKGLTMRTLEVLGAKKKNDYYQQECEKS